MELTARKKQILKIVVESYIDTAEPLGSKAIAERMPEKVSSAYSLVRGIRSGLKSDQMRYLQSS